MRKKILALFAALVLLITALPMSAFAAEEKTYDLEGTTLSAVIPMGPTNVEFGGILEDAVLTVKADGQKEVTLSFMEVFKTTIFGQEATASVDAPSDTVQVAYQKGEEWVDAAVTLYESGVVKTMTFPVTELADTYNVALSINGSQFGGDNPFVLKSGEELAATLTMDWSKVPADTQISAGTYKGTTTADNGTVYTYKLELSEDGNYSYYVEFTMGGTVYSNNETGTYTVDGKTMTFTAVTSEIKEGEVYTAVINGENNFTLTRLASYFSLMSGKTADIAFTLSTNEENDATDKDDTTEKENFGSLESGKYAVDLTWIPFMDNMMDPIVEIDATAKTFKVYNASAPETDKGHGTVAFDSETNVYTLTFEETEGNTTTFTYDAEKDEITFTSELWYGSSSFNRTDDDGNFVSYTATLVKDDATDKDDTTEKENFGSLESGKYAVDLTWIPFMDNMLDPIVELDAEAKTFKVYNASAPETLKGSGSIEFDASSEVYTLVYETKERTEGNTTTFTYDAEKDEITFTSKLWYGASSFNRTDDNGNFVSYTATLVKENNTNNGNNNGNNNQNTSNGNTSNEDNNQDTSNRNTSNENNNQNTSNGTSPNTGEVALNSVWAVMTIAAFGAAAMVLAQKRKNA